MSFVDLTIEASLQLTDFTRIKGLKTVTFDRQLSLYYVLPLYVWDNKATKNMTEQNSSALDLNKPSIKPKNPNQSNRQFAKSKTKNKLMYTNHKRQPIKSVDKLCLSTLLVYKVYIMAKQVKVIKNHTNFCSKLQSIVSLRKERPPKLVEVNREFVLSINEVIILCKLSI